ncbi:MAG: Asp-tRNA(Asn)/Glu-tRNA(Gln) amidotransferase subunit GatA [Saprospirales bacterium]|nr:Asp-tRNA(Asn)/Glu-tRNA(Gln) amidotransferase subunit GatA [Saprospirales bacterium]MBK8921556.1 Asp-tRNA(Asn)/Glu-tRNA(Gln) amidotransferase subunit GatA [Saprospirales bacterium]
MPAYRSLSALQAALLSGETSCRSVVEACLVQIERTRRLNAYVEVWPAEALEQADKQDARIREFRGGTGLALGKLFGAVVSLKDNICYAGHQVSAGSNILAGFSSLFSATAVERIAAADAILIGRTNCDQFGMGSSNENSVYGPVRNAADPERVPGGSSGGAAVALQTGTCLVAMGSDTGGSVRQPAAFCGLWGFKPTYGRISRHGLVAYGSSFDQIGFLAHNPADIERFMAVCAGPDAYDSTAGRTPWQYPGPLQRPARIAWFPEMLDHSGLDAGVRTVVQDYQAALQAAGHELVPVEMPRMGAGTMFDYLVPTYYVLTTAEASSNLARYDGIRYGYRSPNARNLEETYRLSRTEGFSDEVKRRILLGTFVLSSGYYDAYYIKAQQVRRLIQQHTLAILDNCDFILMPATPGVAWRLGEKSDDPVAMYLADIFTVQANLAGVPALAIPAGKHPENGLPVGVQLMAGLWEDAKLLAFAGY